MKKQLLKYILFIGVVLVCFTSCEFDNPYDTEINKPELYINADIQKDSEGAYFFIETNAPKSLVEKSITLENTGAGNLIINSISYTGSGAFTLVSPTSLSNYTIVPGESLDIVISFLPLTVTDYAGVLTIDSNSNSGEYVGSYKLNIVAFGTENVYQGDLDLTTQAQVDAFNYTSIDGNLWVGDLDEVSNSITNLDGLSSLSSVSDYVYIVNNSSLSDISGLENLESTYGLAIHNNSILENIEGIEGISTATGEFYIGYNNSLLSLSPISSLEFVGLQLTVIENASITSLDGLENIASIGAYISASSKTVDSTQVKKPRLVFSQEKGDSKNSLKARSIAEDTDGLIIENNSSLVDFCALKDIFTNDNVSGTYTISGNEYNPTKAEILTNECSNSANVYSDDLNITTQAEIDAFDYTEVTGRLQISGTSITNLDGLSSLKKVGTEIQIFNTFIENTNGLANLSEISGHLTIAYNSKLTTLSALSNIESVDLLFIDNNLILETLDGLDNLTEITANRLQISNNAQLTDISALDGLTTISGNFQIESNPVLENFCAFTDLFTNNGVSGTYSVSGNKYNPTKQQIIDNDCDGASAPVVYNGNLSLTTQAQVDAFAYTEVTGTLTVTGAGITNLDGLSSLTKVKGDYLNISNTNVQNLDGLSNFSETMGLYLQNNANLIDITGLLKITNSTYLYIYFNNKLTSLEGLNNLETVTTNGLFIDNNALLEDLSALSKLTSVSGTNFRVRNNPVLEDFCVFKDLFTNNAVSGTYSVSGNKYNPTKQQIIDNDCDGASAPVVYNGSLNLTTQAQVDAFSYTEVTGYLNIEGSGITNLDGLTSLTKVKGSYLRVYNTNVENLNGLSNVAETMGLYLQNNANLIDISGLLNITNSTYCLIYDNDKLTNLEGLNNLETVTTNGLRIENNALLEDVSALSKLSSVSGTYFRVMNNIVLEDFCVFKDLFTANNMTASQTIISGNKYNPTVIQIKTEACKPPTVYNGNLELTTQAQVDAFAYTEVTGGLNITGTNITNLDGLSSLTKTGVYLQVHQASNITNLNGLSNIENVQHLYLLDNPNLEDISSLTKIKTCKYLYIRNNLKLTSLEGLNNLESISEFDLTITGNSLLNDISALSAITNVSRNIQIQNNPELENFCAFTDLFKNNGNAGTYSVSGNKYNPTKQQIIDNDCDGALAPIVYNGNLSLTTQAQVDAFAYTEVTGQLAVTGSNITNLDGLSSLTEVGTDLLVYSLPNITNLNGLSNVVEIKGLYVQSNANLIDISGLLKITSSTYLLIYDNDKLTNLEGLNNLETVTTNGLRIENNALLEDVSALSKLSSVSGTYFRVMNNAVLEDFCVFKDLFTTNNMTASQTIISGNKYNPTLTQIKTEACKPSNSEGTVTDIDGNVYKTVTIGTQTWMAENLKVTRTSNGTAISNVSNNSTWANLGNNLGYSFYNNDANQSDGAFYNYSAASVVCPQGWRLPSSGDINTLNSFITSQGLNPSTALRATSFSNGTDAYGFSANLTNFRNFNGTFETHPYSLLWGQSGYYYVVESNNDIVKSTNINSYGFCVRCVKE